MKHAMSFLSGAVLIAGAVIWAGGRPMGWFVGGLFTMAVITGTAFFTIGLGRVGRFFTALDQALNPQHPQRPATPGRDETAETSEQTLPNKVRKANVVPLRKSNTMLRPVQQDVVSALMNMGVSQKKAQESVLQASERRPGLDFDTLFRLCVTPPQRAAHA